MPQNYWDQLATQYGVPEAGPPPTEGPSYFDRIADQYGVPPVPPPLPAVAPPQAAAAPGVPQPQMAGQVPQPQMLGRMTGQPEMTGRLTGSSPMGEAPPGPMGPQPMGPPIQPPPMAGRFDPFTPMMRGEPIIPTEGASFPMRVAAGVPNLVGGMLSAPIQAARGAGEMVGGGVAAALEPPGPGNEAALAAMGGGAERVTGTAEGLLESLPVRPLVQAVHALSEATGHAVTPQVLLDAAEGAGWTGGQLIHELQQDPVMVAATLAPLLVLRGARKGVAVEAPGPKVGDVIESRPMASHLDQLRQEQPATRPPQEALPAGTPAPEIPTSAEINRRAGERRQKTASREELAAASGFDPVTLEPLDRRKGERRTPKPEELTQEPPFEIPTMEEIAAAKAEKLRDPRTTAEVSPGGEAKRTAAEPGGPPSRGIAPVEAIPQKGKIRFFKATEDITNAAGDVVQPKGRMVSEPQLLELGYQIPEIADVPVIPEKTLIRAKSLREKGVPPGEGGRRITDDVEARVRVRPGPTDRPAMRAVSRPTEGALPVHEVRPGTRQQPLLRVQGRKATEVPLDAGVEATRGGVPASKEAPSGGSTSDPRARQARVSTGPDTFGGAPESLAGGEVGAPGTTRGLRSLRPESETRRPSPTVRPTAGGEVVVPSLPQGSPHGGAPDVPREFSVVDSSGRYRGGGSLTEAEALAEAKRRSTGGQQFHVERRQPPKSAEAPATGPVRTETTVISRERYEAAKASLRKKTGGGQLNVGIDPTAYKDLVTMGAFHADRLATAAVRGVADFASWSAEMAKEGYTLTAAQMRRIWEAHEVRIVRERSAMPKGPIPAERGKLGRWKREAGPERGSKAFDEMRVSEDRMAHVVRRVHDRLKAEFKGIPAETRREMTTALRGIAGRNPDGSYRYGAISRAGTIPETVLVGEALAPASRMTGGFIPDGRIVGPLLEDGKTFQLYRVTWPDEAKALHEALDPKAREVLDRILAESDAAPIVTAAGDRLPALSRAELKEQFSIEGLTPEEAQAASILARKAYGPHAAGKVTPNEWSWVPDVDLDRGSLSSRLRGSFAYKQASSRFKKTGAIAERAKQSGKDIDLRESLKKATTELAIEDMRNQMVAKAFHILAEPIRKGETIESILADGYTPLSRTGEYVASVKVRRRMKKLADTLEAMGIDLPDVMEATYVAGGKGFKIPTRILNDLSGRPGLEATTSPKLRKRMQAADRAIGDMLGSISTWLLTGVSTASRNAVSQTLTFAPKVIRDFYRGVLQQIPGQKFQELPMMDFLADVRSLGVAHGKKTRTRFPPEALGSTLLMDLEKAGPMTKSGGRVLRATGFNYWDVYGKRLPKEAVYHAEATRAWNALGPAGQKGKTKKAWIEDYKNGVPKEIEAAAYRDMEFAGGFDYDNVPRAIEALKRSHIGRAIVPYPTYFYKLLANTYAELMPSPRNLRNAFQTKDKAAQINAYANMLTGATIFGTLWALVDSDEKPVEELTGELGEATKHAEDVAGRKVKESDLPGQVQKFGRVHVPGTEQWVRLIDQPFIGEVIAAKAIFGANYTFNDWMNDRISTGPLFNIIAAQQGLFNIYNSKLTVGTRVGQGAASVLPFQGELRLARKLSDPIKRQPGSEGQSGFRNFAEGLADNLPVASTFLKPRIRLGAADIPKYDPVATSVSYLLLNLRPINEAERKAAIAAVGLAMLGETKTELNREKMRKQIEAIEKVHGSSIPTELQKFIQGHNAEIEFKLTRTANAVEVQRAWMDEGPEAAEKKARALVDAAPKEQRKALWDSAETLLKKLSKESRLGLSKSLVKKSPPRIRKEAAEELERLESDAP